VSASSMICVVKGVAVVMSCCLHH